MSECIEISSEATSDRGETEDNEELSSHPASSDYDDDDDDDDDGLESLPGDPENED